MKGGTYLGEASDGFDTNALFREDNYYAYAQTGHGILERIKVNFFSASISAFRARRR